MKLTKSKSALAALALMLSTIPTVAVPQRDDVEQRINALLARMTLEEKLGQLQQLDGEANGNYRPEHIELVRRGLLGSTLNVRGARRTNELQRIAVEQSRLKIPLIFAFDVIHGYRTIFPVPLAEAATLGESNGAMLTIFGFAWPLLAASERHVDDAGLAATAAFTIS